MTGLLLLDWAILSISLANTILLLWLGLTVLLNAERRSWGVWVMGIGLLLGAAFFVSHTAILGNGLQAIGEGMNFWWQVGWIPVVLAPLAWYIVMLWYAGFWETPHPPLYRRQRAWMWLTVATAITLVGLLIFANPLPSFTQVAQFDLSSALAFAGIPVVLIVYPIYIVLCIALALDGLRRPGPSRRLMGDLARERTRPWLVGASATLLIVSLLVGIAMVWIEAGIRSGRLTDLYHDTALLVGTFDLVIGALIGLAVILTGQGIVTYEVFTGKALPRRGFFRHWRSAVILAMGYGVVIGGTLVIRVQPVYSLLLTAMIMTIFYALFGWRSFDDRQRFVRWLRPFVSTPDMQDASSETGSASAKRIFEAMCDQVLSAERASLVPLGSMAALAGPALNFPSDANGNLPVLASMGPLYERGTDWIELDPQQYEGLRWAIPLWSERGMIGTLLLGEKRDRGLYTQEELEIARASSERLIEVLAGEEMARRLMELQRHRLTQTQVMDRQVRRSLHDDILPDLHTAILGLSPLAHDHPQVQPVIETLSAVHHHISDLIHDLPIAPLRSEHGLVPALKRLITDEFDGEFEEVTWEIDAELPEIGTLQMAVLYNAFREVVRNAAVHGRGTDPGRPLCLAIHIEKDQGLTIIVEDDGIGLGGSGTSDGQHGLALHGTLMIVVGGSLQIEIAPVGGTRVKLRLPAGVVISESGQSQ